MSAGIKFTRYRYAPGTKNAWRLFIVISLILLLTVSFSLIPFFRVLFVQDLKTGQYVYMLSVNEGDRFAVAYKHSVNKSPVEDWFRIDNDKIVLEKTVFRAFGAGIPEHADPGQVFTIYPDKMEISGINREIADYRLFVGIVAGHALIAGDLQISLDQLVKPQTAVRIGTDKISAVRFISQRGAFSVGQNDQYKK